MVGVLENSESDLALKSGPSAPPPPAAAGARATLTVTQYRELFALPPLLNAIQRGALGRYALAPLVRAVHVPDGTTSSSLIGAPFSYSSSCAAPGASLQCRADEFRCVHPAIGAAVCRPLAYLCDGVSDCAAEVDELRNYTCGALPYEYTSAVQCASTALLVSCELDERTADEL